MFFAILLITSPTPGALENETVSQASEATHCRDADHRIRLSCLPKGTVKALSGPLLYSVEREQRATKARSLKGSRRTYRSSRR